MRLGVLSVAAALIILVSAHPRPASADHSVYLPYAGQTWLAKIIKANQEYTFCLDSRAAAYPQFAAQLEDVNYKYTERTGIRARQVSFGDPSCQVHHVMLPAFPCGAGAAACIYYGNAPVVIHYQETLGFTDWRSAQGHELGHGILGQLNEMYVDRGSIGCDSSYQGMINRLGFETVMSCGTGVRYPTAVDVERGCAVIQTSWCGTSGYSKCQTIDYDPCTGRWYFADGWSYAPASGVWFNPEGLPEWSPCNTDRLRYNYTVLAWMPPGSSFFLPPRGYWSLAGEC